MKAIKILDIEVSSDTPPVDLPPEAERKIASMTNNQGSQLVTFWFKGQQKMLNTDLSRLRNCATLETYPWVDVATPIVEFVEINGNEALHSEFRVARVTRPQAGDWTLVFAGQTISPAAGGNYGLFGNNLNDAKGYTNPPNINITSTNIRISSLSDKSTWIINAEVPLLHTQPHVIVVSQSVANGLTLRVDGVQVAARTDATGKVASTGTQFDLFRAGLTSAVAKCNCVQELLMSDDLTKTPDRLQIVEDYYKTILGIA